MIHTILSCLLLGSFLLASKTHAGGQDLISSAENSPFLKSPRIEVSSLSLPVCTGNSIKVVGLSPNQKIALHLIATDPSGQTWSSSAWFRADASGIVDIKKESPLYGSYTTCDPMGLFFHLQCKDRQINQKELSHLNDIKLILEEEQTIKDSILIHSIFIP